ncbi:9005_t:CDS:2 [Funneliformis geosporum]|uniref:9005_t:CDS:1 n=1 Tax=Funneliformis geosporum TaxID=1117311 RepID=A0A9W4SSL8_9GLOM|nr:9005_t:CDS:2 [Funneliformis geosporum]
MEFVDVTKELDKKLDLYHYFEKTIIGFYVRFIMCDKKYELTLSDKIMQIEDPDKKYKQIDDYAQKKRTYRNAIKKVQEILYQKIGSLYETFYGEWLNYKIFMESNPIKILWERFMKYTIKITKDKNLSVNDEMKEKICSYFARYPSELVKCIEEYNLFFHKLVYHMCYKEHISIPEEISPVSSIRKNEIIVDLLALPYISEIEALNDISNLWYFHFEDITGSEALAKYLNR